jgi:hypothetical protein
MEMLKTLKEKILGTEAQNKKAAENLKDNPMEKKFQKMMGNEPKETKPVEKAKGGMIKSSASKRADGCAVKGKTRGKMVTMNKGGAC